MYEPLSMLQIIFNCTGKKRLCLEHTESTSHLVRDFNNRSNSGQYRTSPVHANNAKPRNLNDTHNFEYNNPPLSRNQSENNHES